MCSKQVEKMLYTGLLQARVSTLVSNTTNRERKLSWEQQTFPVNYKYALE